MLRDRVQSCGLWNPETCSVFNSVPRLQFQLHCSRDLGAEGPKRTPNFALRLSVRDDRPRAPYSAVVLSPRANFLAPHYRAIHERLRTGGKILHHERV